MKRYTDDIIALIDSKMQEILGEHYVAVKAEFVDFHNDMRVARVRELRDLGLPLETAENAL